MEFIMSELNQGHGDSWATIYNDTEALLNFIPTAISQATEVLGHAEMPYQPFEGRVSTKQVIGILYPFNIMWVVFF